MVSEFDEEAVVQMTQRLESRFDDVEEWVGETVRQYERVNDTGPTLMNRVHKIAGRIPVIPDGLFETIDGLVDEKRDEEYTALKQSLMKCLEEKYDKNRELLQRFDDLRQDYRDIIDPLQHRSLSKFLVFDLELQPVLR